MKFKLDFSDLFPIITVLVILSIGLYTFSIVIQSIPTQNTSSNITDETLQNISQIFDSSRPMLDILILFIAIVSILWLLSKHSAFRHESKEEMTTIVSIINNNKEKQNKESSVSFPKPLVPLSTAYPQQNGDYILFTETLKSLSKEITSVQESLGLWTKTVPIDDTHVVIYISKWTKQNLESHGHLPPLWKPIQIKK